jgi:aminoglycoside phosphotransferase (APT) family kinase protein
MNPWDNQNPLTSEQIGEVISQQFPELRPVTTKKIGEGWDNTTWKVNDEWLFRFPKHQAAATLLQDEIRLLPALDHLPLNIPNPCFIGQPNQIAYYPFYGHQFLHGQTAEQYQLTRAERIPLAKPLAEFLKNLHGFPLARALEMGIQYDRRHRINVKVRFTKAQECLDYLVEHAVIPSVEPWLNFFKYYQDLETPPVWVLSHGDLYAKHLLLDDNKKLSAVIDWGDAEILHPAVDLALLYEFIPPEGHDAFWNIYGEVTETTRILAKLRAIYGGATIAWYAHHIGDQLLLKEALQALDFLSVHLCRAH